MKRRTEASDEANECDGARIIGAVTTGAVVNAIAARAASAVDYTGVDWSEVMKTTERAPKVSAPIGGDATSGASTFTMPDMPKIDMPKLDGFKAPEVDLSAFKMPAALDKFEAPKMDSFKMPEMPEIKMPEMPEIKMPDAPVATPVPVAVPAAPVAAAPVAPPASVAPPAAEMKMPEMPEMKMPEMPEMKMPEVPKFDMPKDIKMPDVPKFDLPKDIKIPDVPKFDMPNVPKFDIPKVDAPEFDFSGATNAFNGATSGATNAFNGATSAFNGATSGATDAFNGATGAFDDSLKGANDALNAFESGVLSSASSAVIAGLDAVKGVLPSEFAGLIEMAKDDQDVALALAALLVLSPTLVGAFFDNLRGYGGSKRPFFVNEQLEKNSRAFLIDTRDAEDRKENGVPDLRKSARNRGAAVEVVTLDERTRRITQNPRAVELRIAGELVQKLTKRGAQIYFLGPEAAALAKQVQSMGGGRKCFTVAGDFNAWRSEGLKIRRKASYGKNVLDVVGEETSDLAKAGSTYVQTRVGTARTSIKSTVDSTSPAGKAAVLIGFLALAYAVSEYEKSLAFIGFLGLQWSLYNKVMSYESPAALFEDLSQALSPVASIAGELASTASASAMTAASTAGSAALEKAQKSSTEMSIPSLADMSVPSAEQQEDANEEA